MIKKIKYKIINLIGEQATKKIQYFMNFNDLNKFKKYKNSKKIFHISTPIHGNMGDQAITYATNRFLSKEFSEYKLIEVYRRDIYKYGKAIKKVINDDDIIFLVGGGNMGNLYVNEEIDRRFIIDKFKRNKIVSMPQTISFTKDKDGHEELNKTKRIYTKHNNLTLIAREKKSYNIMKKEINNANIIINPDIVMYLHDMYRFDKENRKRIMTCLRSDKESVLGKDKEIFIDKLNKEYKDVFNYDTVINKIVTRDIRESELMTMFNEFRKSKVVITDRLHGMVFCAITKTPCIVTKSLDHKVTGTYEWIKKLNYIKLVDKLDFDTIKPIIDELSSLDSINEINFKELYFDKLREKILV